MELPQPRDPGILERSVGGPLRLLVPIDFATTPGVVRVLDGCRAVSVTAAAPAPGPELNPRPEVRIFRRPELGPAAGDVGVWQIEERRAVLGGEADGVDRLFFEILLPDVESLDADPPLPADGRLRLDLRLAFRGGPDATLRLPVVVDPDQRWLRVAGPPRRLDPPRRQRLHAALLLTLVAALLLWNGTLHRGLHGTPVDAGWLDLLGGAAAGALGFQLLLLPWIRRGGRRRGLLRPSPLPEFRLDPAVVRILRSRVTTGVVAAFFTLFAAAVLLLWPAALPPDPGPGFAFADGDGRRIDRPWVVARRAPSVGLVCAGGAGRPDPIVLATVRTPERCAGVLGCGPVPELELVDRRFRVVITDSADQREAVGSFPGRWLASSSEGPGNGDGVSAIAAEVCGRSDLGSRVAVRFQPASGTFVVDLGKSLAAGRAAALFASFKEEVFQPTPLEEIAADPERLLGGLADRALSRYFTASEGGIRSSVFLALYRRELGRLGELPPAEAWRRLYAAEILFAVYRARALPGDLEGRMIDGLVELYERSVTGAAHPAGLAFLRAHWRLLLAVEEHRPADAGSKIHDAIARSLSHLASGDGASVPAGSSAGHLAYLEETFRAGALRLRPGAEEAVNARRSFFIDRCRILKGARPGGEDVFERKLVGMIEVAADDATREFLTALLGSPPTALRPPNLLG